MKRNPVQKGLYPNGYFPLMQAAFLKKPKIGRNAPFFGKNFSMKFMKKDSTR